MTRVTREVLFSYVGGMREAGVIRRTLRYDEGDEKECR